MLFHIQTPIFLAKVRTDVEDKSPFAVDGEISTVLVASTKPENGE